MGILDIYDAAIALGHVNVSVEQDLKVWTGSEKNKHFLTTAEMKKIKEKAEEIIKNKQSVKQSILDKLGISQEELTQLLG